MKSFKRLHPVDTTAASASPPPAPHTMQLVSGDEVYYPEDLLPLVDSPSKIADVIEESRSRRLSANWLQGGAIAAYAVGTGVFITGLVIKSPSGTEGIGEHPASIAALFIGLGVALLGGGAMQGAAGTLRSISNDQKETVFHMFPGALRKNLFLCGPLDRVIDCSQ